MTEQELHEHGIEIACKGFKHRTWIPTKLDNQSKLELHYWDGVKWHGTSHVRFVPSHEWGSWE